MKVEPIAISKLKPAPYNPRTLSDERRKDLQRSLDEFGLVEPLVWNRKTGHVVGGNQRLMLLKESGRKRIDCAVVNLTLKREKLLNLRLNKTSGEWDAPLLSEMLKELDPGDWSLTGFDDIEIEPLVFDAPVVEDDIPDPPKTPVTKPGDLWKLGDHRLLSGCSATVSGVGRLFDGERARLVWTDPPYGVGYVGGFGHQFSPTGTPQERRPYCCGGRPQRRTTGESLARIFWGRAATM